MGCDHNWTIKFPDVNENQDPFEIRPKTLTLKISRQQYDFARGEFPWEVGEEMKPHTRYNGGALTGHNRAAVCYNGNPVKYLLFTPDGADYGRDSTHLRFTDLHKVMTDGIVDMQRETIHLRDIYQDVKDSVDSDLIQGSVQFNLGENQIRTIYSGAEEAEGASREARADRVQAEINEDAIQVNGEYAVDFDKITPEQAIRRLNQKYRLKSWLNREGQLVVGLPEDEPAYHIASPDDDRVWRYKDPSVTHANEPINRVIVEGPWVDISGINPDPRSWFDEGGTSEVQLFGFAVRDDINYGRTEWIQNHDVNKNSLEQFAKGSLVEKTKQANAGTVEIDPDLSGNEWSGLINVQPGDTLRLAPDDKHFANPDEESGQVGDDEVDPDEVCGGFVHNDEYLITEVEHNVVESGGWQVFTDVSMIPEFSVTTSKNFWRPGTNEWVSDGKVNNGNWFEEF